MTKVDEDQLTNDIFAWANNLVGDREDYDVHLYFLNKNGIVYSINADQAVQKLATGLFLDSAIEYTLEGAANDLVVRKYEDTVKGDKHTLAWISLEKVYRAKQAIDWIEEHSADIETFRHDEYDIKRQKGVFAKFTKPGSKTFYVFKSFSGTAAVSNKDFVMRGGKVSTFSDETAFKIDPSAQVVVIENDVYAFSQSKFESLFDVKPHQVTVANQNGAILDRDFKLSMPLVVQEIAILAQQNNAVLKKLADVNPHAMSMEQALEAIDEYGVPLMLDDNGAIILMDAKDVNVLLDVIADNYLSGVNGHYLAKSKKPFESEVD